MSSSSPKRDSDHEDLYDDEEDEPYTDEEEANLDNTEPKATGEVCVEKPLSVKEQIKNFANLKIQELLGPQAVSSTIEATTESDLPEPYHEEEDYHDPEEQEQEEYEYSVASDSEHYSHQNESCRSPSFHPEESFQQHQLEEPITPVSKINPVAAFPSEEATIVPVEKPTVQQIQKSVSPCPQLPAPVQTQYRQPAPEPTTPMQAQQLYTTEEQQFAQPATVRMEHVSGGNHPHQVQQYRPPEPAVDPYMRASGRGKGGWVSGQGGAVQLSSAGRGAAQQPQIYLGYEIVSDQNAGSVNIGLRRLTSDRQWGFTLYGGVDAGCPPFVNHVSLNSPAYQMGLEIGDVVLAICGVPAEGKNLYSLKAEILRAGNELDFVILKQAIDLSKLIQRAPQVVPQLIRGGQQKAGLQRSHSGRNRNNSFARNSNGSFEEPDYGGVVSGQGIRPVQTRSLRILEEQLAKGVSPGSAVQSKQHYSGARGLSVSGEKSTIMTAYGQNSFSGYAGRSYEPQPAAQQSYVVSPGRPRGQDPRDYEVHSPPNYYNQGQYQSGAYTESAGYREPMRTYPAYSSNAMNPSLSPVAVKSSVNLYVDPSQYLHRSQPQQYYY